MQLDPSLVLLRNFRRNYMKCKAMNHSNFLTILLTSCKIALSIALHKLVQHEEKLFKVSNLDSTVAGRTSVRKLRARRFFNLLVSKYYHLIPPGKCITAYIRATRTPMHLFSMYGNTLQNAGSRRSVWILRMLQEMNKTELSLWNMTWQTNMARCMRMMTYRESIAM